MNVFFSVSSRTKINKSYFEDVAYISKFVSSLGNNLVIGVAMDNGMSGAALENFKENDRNIFLKTLKKYGEDPKHFYYVDFEYTSTTFDRTREIYNNSDVLLIMPGGTGTVAEIFSFIEEMRTNENNKQLLIYNKNHHYDILINMINEFIKKGFNDIDILDYIQVFDTKEEIVNYFFEKTNSTIKKI